MRRPLGILETSYLGGGAGEVGGAVVVGVEEVAAVVAVAGPAPSTVADGLPWSWSISAEKWCSTRASCLVFWCVVVFCSPRVLLAPGAASASMLPAQAAFSARANLQTLVSPFHQQECSLLLIWTIASTSILHIDTETRRDIASQIGILRQYTGGHGIPRTFE
jgi:hypothetical protein